MHYAISVITSAAKIAQHKTQQSEKMRKLCMKVDCRSGSFSKLPGQSQFANFAAHICAVEQ